jgi:lipoprotein-anchoring transpeptidase ErfK/SrfK
MKMFNLIKLGFAAIVMPSLLVACAPMTNTATIAKTAAPVLPDSQRYAALSDEPFPVSAIPSSQLKPQFMRQLVDDPTGQPPGTIVVDPQNRYLYLVQSGGKAFRYGVGVGREGMAWSGTAKVAYKRQWPRWTPTQDMIAREPDKYQKWATGMDGGDRNPLGARALYLFEGGKDTLCRIHGTTEPGSIGKAMSSGCIRMMNQDVIDLYGRVPDGAKVVALPVHGAAA